MWKARGPAAPSRVRGSLRLVLGETALVLEPGEAAEFSSSTPHWMAGPAEALILMGHEGERANLRVSSEA